MAAATVTLLEKLSLGGLDMDLYHLTTAANGEDGVTFKHGMRTFLGAFVTGREAATGATGPFAAFESAGTVTVEAVAGAGGDAKKVAVLVLGFRG